MYAVLLVFSGAQTLVDSGWVWIYSDNYYEEKSTQEMTKAGADKEKIAASNQKTFLKNIFVIVFFTVLQVAFGIWLVVLIA